MKKLALHWQILIAIALGVVFGIFFSTYTGHVKWAGDIFLRALRMIVIPIVFTSLFNGMTGIGPSMHLGRIAGKTLGLYAFTTLVAAVLGLILCNIIKPGVGVAMPIQEGWTDTATAKLSLLEQLIAIVPQNIFEDLSKGNLLPVIFFAILFGYFTTLINEKPRKVLTDFFDALYQVTMKVTMFIIKFTPIGIFAIVANMVGAYAGDHSKLLGVAQGLGLYTGIVWAGCLIQGALVLPGLVYFLGNVNPWKHIQKMSAALLTAFSTCSSGATLPLSMRDTEEKCGVSNKIVSFTLPLGATINMNGTALYECVSALFIAQLFGIDLTVGQQIIMVLTVLLAAVGAAGIPMAGIVMMAVVLDAVGLPREGIGIVLAVQQLCDMARTTINVYGDMCVAVIVAKTEGEELTI